MSRAAALAVGAAAGLGGWAVLSAARSGGDAGPMLAALSLGIGGFLFGLLLQRWATAVAVGAVATVAVAALASNDAFSTSPLAGPTHYANANAALYVQISALAGVAAARCRPSVTQGALCATAVVGAALPLVIGSAAAAVGGVAIAGATLLAVARPVGSTRTACALGALSVLLACAGSVVVAERHGNGVPDDARLAGVAEALTERRVELWRDAGRLALDHPLTGIGPVRFGEASRIARFDADTRAAHSAPLEVAAETGLPGAALLFLAVGAVLATLWTRGRAARPALVAVVAWTAFWLHADVDYIADFPAVVATAAIVAGLGTPIGRLDRPNG